MIPKDWIVGFTEGEGSFYISFNKSKRPFRFVPSFSIFLHYKEKLILEQIRDFFGVGKIYRKNARKSQPNPQYCYEAYGNYAYIIKDFFLKQNLLTTKKQDFELWCKCLDILKKGQSKENLLEVARIRDKMNIGHKHNYKYMNYDKIKELLFPSPSITLKEFSPNNPLKSCVKTEKYLYK